MNKKYHYIIIGFTLLLAPIFLYSLWFITKGQFNFSNNEKVKFSRTISIDNPGYSCKTNIDCVTVKEAWCGTIRSVNKSYQGRWTEIDKANAKLSEQNRTTCKVSTKEYSEITNFVPVCINNKCEARFNTDNK